MLVTKKEKNLVVLSNQSEVFAESELVNEDFSVTVCPLSKVDEINMMQDCINTDTNKIDAGKYSKALYVMSISNTTGFLNELGEELEMGEELEQFLWEDAPSLLQTAIKDVIDGFKKDENEKKSETVDLIEPIQSGVPYHEQNV